MIPAQLVEGEHAAFCPVCDELNSDRGDARWSSGKPPEFRENPLDAPVVFQDEAGTRFADDGKLWSAKQSVHFKARR